MLRNTGRLPEAETALRRALVMIEKDFGPEHPALAPCLNNLADVLEHTNRVAEAEPLIRRALEIDRKAYGEEHPNVAFRLNNLGYALRLTNQFDEAEKTYWAALAISQVLLALASQRISPAAAVRSAAAVRVRRAYVCAPRWSSCKKDSTLP